MIIAGSMGYEDPSTTRISTDLEELWRNQFFTLQQSTPVGSSAEKARSEPQDRILQVTGTLRFTQSTYEPAIIRFYEDVIAELQREVSRYKSLWESLRTAAEPEGEAAYVARQGVSLPPTVAKKLRAPTKPPFRPPVE